MTHAFGGEFGTATTQRKCTCVSYIKVDGWMDLIMTKGTFPWSSDKLTARSKKGPIKFKKLGRDWVRHGEQQPPAPFKVVTTALCGPFTGELTGSPGDLIPIPAYIPPNPGDQDPGYPRQFRYPACSPNNYPNGGSHPSHLGSLCRFKYKFATGYADEKGSGTSFAVSFSEAKIVGPCTCKKVGGEQVSKETTYIDIDISGSGEDNSVMQAIAKKVVNAVKHLTCADGGGSQ